MHNYEDRSAHEVIPSQRLFLGHFDYAERVRRPDRVPEQDKVLGDFEERRLGLSEQEAAVEAARCMSCGMCFECDNCVIFCPQDAVFRVTITPQFSQSKSYEDVKVEPWTDEMSDW